MLTDDNHGQLLVAMDEPRVNAAWDQVCQDLVEALVPLGLALELDVNLFETHRAHQCHERLFKPVQATQGEALFVRLRALLCSDGAFVVHLFAHDDQGFSDTGAPAVLRAQLFASPPLPEWRIEPNPPFALAEAWVQAGFTPKTAAWRTALTEACERLDASLRS